MKQHKKDMEHLAATRQTPVRTQQGCRGCLIIAVVVTAIAIGLLVLLRH